MNTTQKLRFSLDPATGRLSEEDTRRYLSRIGFAVFGLTVVQQVAWTLLAFLAAAFLPENLLTSPLVSNILSAAVLYGLAFPVFFYLLKPLPVVDPLEGSFGTKDLFGGLCVSFALMMAGNYVSQILTAWLSVFMGNPLENPVEVSTAASPWYINLIFVGILAPVMEELVFRKILCRRLLPLGEGYAIVLSSAAFGLCHGNLFQFFYAFALGLLFALIYVKTGKLRYSIFYHMVINLLGGVFSSWLSEQLRLDELIVILEELMLSGSTDMSPLAPFALPLTLLLVYDILMYVGAFIGIVLIFRHRKRIVLSEGLLPPPKEGRVANVFMNTGTAAALGAFAVVFLLSLLS